AVDLRNDKGCIRQHAEACTKVISHQSVLLAVGRSSGLHIIGLNHEINSRNQNKRCRQPPMTSREQYNFVVDEKFVTANAIVREVDREYLEAFQSPATFANREILRSSRSYFLLSKVVLAPKKEQDCPKH